MRSASNVLVAPSSVSLVAPDVEGVTVVDEGNPVAGELAGANGCSSESIAQD